MRALCKTLTRQRGCVLTPPSAQATGSPSLRRAVSGRGAYRLVSMASPEALVSAGVPAVPIWDDGVAADSIAQTPRNDHDDGFDQAEDNNGTSAPTHLYGPQAIPLPSVEEGRSQYNGNTWGDVVLVSPPHTGHLPFLNMSVQNNEFAWQAVEEADNAAQRHLHLGRFDQQHIRALSLRENGMLICGEGAVPPDWTWKSTLCMEDGFNSHLDDNVHSYGRKPLITGIAGCENLLLSLMPSVSGGYVLAQEQVPENVEVMLCLHKSTWRDRIVLEEGMKLVIGSHETSSCTLDIMSITGEPRRPVELSTKIDNEVKQVRFGTSTEIDTGRIRQLTSSVNLSRNSRKSRGRGKSIDAKALIDEIPVSEFDEDLMSFAPIWADSETHDRASRMLMASRRNRNNRGGVKSSSKLPRSKLVLRYAIDGKHPRIINFAPPVEELQAQTRSSVSHQAHLKRGHILTVGGSDTCDIVLPGCPVKIVATITAFDNVFTLMCPHSLSDVFQRGAKLNKSQLLYARMTAVHLILTPGRPWGIYDGDAIAVTNRRIRDSSEHDCCTGVEIHVRIADPTEKRRLKLNKTNLAEIGVKQVPVTPLSINKSSWLQYAVVGNEPKAVVKQRGRQNIVELAIEVRAPVRVSSWDGSNVWRYGKVESFIFDGISNVTEATIGGSRQMTLSINDAQMSRCHATIFKRGGKKTAFLMEASRSAGRKTVLQMIASSSPPGLGSAATPPHLLLAGEVFRVGASEFRVIGFTKDGDRVIGRPSNRSGDRGTIRSTRIQIPRVKSTGAQGTPDEEESAYDSDNSSKGSTRDSRRGISARFNGNILKLSPRAETQSGDDDGNPAADGETLGDASQDVDGQYWPNDEEEDEDDEDETRAEKERQSVRRNEERLMEERLAQIETLQFQELQSEGDEHMLQKIETPGSIPLVRHFPNQIDPSNHINIVSSYRDEEDGAEVHITNNVDKSFGLARVDEYNDVLNAFGLDSDTRAITFPDLDSFMIIQCIKGPLQRRIFLVDKNECTIGRSPSCSISVPNDPLISPLHCRIVYNSVEEHWRLIDCCSRMGTFLRTAAGDDGIFLQPGQRFLIGKSQLRILGRPRQHTSRTYGIRKQIRSVATAAMRRGSYTQITRASHSGDARDSHKAEPDSDDESDSKSYSDHQGATMIQDASAPTGCGCIVS